MDLEGQIALEHFAELQQLAVLTLLAASMGVRGVSGFQQHKEFLPPVCEYPRQVERGGGYSSLSLQILQLFYSQSRDLKGWAGVNIYINIYIEYIHQYLGINLLMLINNCEAYHSFFTLESLHLFMYCYFLLPTSS